MKAIVIAGTVSGVGKTTIASGLMGALSRRNLNVQPFKTGPDYIDPTYHTMVTGVPSRNLDTWMLSHPAVLELFTRAMSGKDIAVIEGVMGLYDGRSSTSDEGSTAELAKLLGAPVLLIVDCRKGARSVAAMVAGYKVFDAGVRIGGVILNGIGSPAHLKFCQEAIEHYTGVKVMGYLPRRDDLLLPERHLGLIPTGESPLKEDFIERLISQCEATFDIAGILRLSEEAVVPEAETVLFPAVRKPPAVRIALARDKAFSFYYQDSLDLLEAWGAEIVPFSPLQDSCLPTGVSGIYIGGGFPEVYAEQLGANIPMKNAVSAAVKQGMPVYAECGGLMYMGRSIRDLEGKEHAMVGAIPVSTRIDKPQLNLGYRIIEALADGPVLRKGEVARGHEFHWSVLQAGGISPNAYRIADKDGRIEGFQQGNVLASYVHFHLGTLPSMPARLIDCCLNFQKSRNSSST